MSTCDYEQRFFVADRLSGTIQFQQPLGEWFKLSLVDRTLFEAGVAGLGGTAVRPDFETVDGAQGRIVGWRITLVSRVHGAVFRRDWPLEVLRPTALAVASRCMPASEDGRVLYGVKRVEAEGGKLSRNGCIEFEPDQDMEGADGMATVPDIPVITTPVEGKIVSDSFPCDVVVVFDWQALAAVLKPIRDGLSEQREIAWAAGVRIARCAGNRTLFYQVTTLKPIASENATATRVPLDAGRLLAAVPSQGPLLLLHTHVVPPEETADRHAFLAPSWDDFRCVYRLKTGSLFGILSGRLPLEVRLYGFGDNSVAELSARIVMTDK